MGLRRPEMMDAKEWEQELAREGFGDFFVWRDGPNTFYPEHAHSGMTAHVILEGEMTLTWEGQTRTFKAGERANVPAGAIHSARMGPRGCQYLVGQK
jgi:mannose-6-phosphate isomerase-like protein (cupin superfamily)